MHIKNKKGQSTVEYVLLVTAVLTVIIGFVATKNSQFQTQLNTGLNAVSGDMNSLASTLSDSHQPSTASAAAQAPAYSVQVTPGANTKN